MRPQRNKLYAARKYIFYKTSSVLLLEEEALENLITLLILRGVNAELSEDALQRILRTCTHDIQQSIESVKRR